jgi:hypothetical protein
MPGFDRTGPQGLGPMTGGGFGLCGRNTKTTVQNELYPRGAGRGGMPWGGGRGRVWGGGRGRNYRSQISPLRQTGYAGGPGRSAGYPPSSDTELESLRALAERLEQEMTALTERIHQLEAEKPE